MNVELPIWQCLALMAAFFGAVAAGAKMLFTQFDKRMAERFKAQEVTLGRYMDDQGKMAIKLQELEREFLVWRGDMPMHYVRREDHIRNQTIIEAKLDAISQRVQNLQLKANIQ